MKVYIIGSLRSDNVPAVAKYLRLNTKHDIFDDWYAAGPEADDMWQKYEQARDHGFSEALKGHAAQHVYLYDKKHLDEASAGVLVLPAGKSGHLEAGYLIGQGKPVYILLQREPERFDVMYNFATMVTTSLMDIAVALNELTPSYIFKFVPVVKYTPTLDPNVDRMPPITNFDPYTYPSFKRDHLPEGST
jgi:hypothetical protein